MSTSQQDEFKGYRLSGWWRRVGAYLLDGLILWAIYLVVFGILGLVLISTGETSLIVLFVVLVLLGSIAIMIAYYGFSMARPGVHNGQSFGKQALGISVIREDGEAVYFWYAIKRQVVVMQLLFGMIFNLFTSGIATLLDYLWPLWDDKRQALHDKMVSSRVAYAKEESFDDSPFDGDTASKVLDNSSEKLTKN